LVQTDQLLDALDEHRMFFQQLISNLTEEQLNYRYDTGKWTIRQLVGHLIDSERIFAYRALRFARKDATELASFDENAYADASNASQLNIKDLLKEHWIVRESTLLLFRSFDYKMLDYAGTASKNRMTVRALGYAILGHEMHHLQIIKERYLKS
jgi:uncharacterized damage-inducible protein DinB